MQINQINSDLNEKHYQQQNMINALHSADSTIIESDQVLAHLRQERKYNLQQLQQISSQLVELNQTLSVAKDTVGVLFNQAYQDLQYAKSTGNSLFSGENSTQVNIRKHYLVAILTDKQNTYQQLQNKLAKLDKINAKLEFELSKLDDKLGYTSDYKYKLVQSKSTQMKQIKEIDLQISSDQQKLNNLKQKQKQLNQLILTLAQANTQANTKATNTKTNTKVTTRLNATTKTNSHATFDTNTTATTIRSNTVSDFAESDDNIKNSSLFLKHRLIRPFNAKIAINFGAMRGDVKNNGILFDVSTTDTNQVYAIASGKVMYVGNLSGFGELVIVDHGNNYMSIYSGVKPGVSRGDSVNSGQEIATVSDKSSQPMGGVYFELRHLGRPVNPNLFIN